MYVDCVWNVMAHAQKPDFVFRRNGRVHLNMRGRQFSRLLAAEVCASAVVMLDTPCSEVVWRVLATHSIRQFPLHFPTRASPCAIKYETHYTTHHSPGMNSKIWGARLNLKLFAELSGFLRLPSSKCGSQRRRASVLHAGIGIYKTPNSPLFGSA